ncbi:MAG: LamG domain-containing protein, partial [Cyclobacteriaceae bacterium]
MKIRARNTLLSLLSLLWVTSAIAQEDCKDDINYSVSNFTVQGGDRSYLRNNRSVIQATIGQHATGVTGGYSNGIEAEFGFWGHYFLEPQAPRSSASEGEYVDRIEVQWEVVNDYKGPIVTENVTQIFRNGRLITTVPLKQTTYVDYNVFPGEFYTYEIITSNNLGDSKPMKAVGFLNPNGRVTGKVETRNGTPVADVKVVLTPNLGQSLDFDGVNDYVYFVDQAYQFNKYYTVEGWWRNVEVKNQTIFVAVDSGTTNILVKISLDDQGRIRYFHDGNADGTGIELISKNGYNLDVLTRDWHHFAAVYDTANVYLYVDGNRVAEAVPEQPITTVAELEFAKDGPKQYSGYFNGFMDDFRVWNIGRERAELRKYKDITLTGEEAYLKNYWKFDEQFSNKVFDFAKKPVPDRDNGYICDVTRSSFISPAQLGAYTDAGGDYLIKGIFYGNGQTFSAAPSKATPIGYSLDFDGTDDYVSYQLDRVTYDQAFTLEGWFKTGVSGKEMVIFEASNPEDTYQFIQLGIQTTGEFYANVGFGGATSTITSANAVNDEFWYHYALVHDGTTATLYIDGVSEGTTANAGVAEITRSVIGRSGTSENNAGAKYFQGSIDEMRLWNYARTSNQVNATLNQIIPGNEQGIVDTDGTLGVDAYWMFGEGGGSIISDQTPNGHAGELMNFQEITLGSGDKLVANWNGDDLPLDVEFFNHDFDPNARNVSLDPSNTSVDRVDFTDISQIAISGFVRFANTDCFAPNVEMTINGGSFLPPVYTNADGKFTVELEPGTTNAFLASKYEDFAFNPGFIELPRLVRPIAGLRFETNTVRQIKGIVGGGECLIPLGTANVLVQSANGCFEKTVAVDVNTGEFIAEDLPPLNYQVSIVGHENTSTVQSFFNLQGAVTVDLTKKNDSISFIYTSATNIKLAFDNPEPNTCGYQVDSETATFLNQNSEYDLGIKLYQLYKSDTCFLASGSVSIDDQISDFSPSAVVDVVNGLGTYTLLAGVPNLAAPYKKTITVFGTEQANGAVLPATLASTIVFGFKTLQSTFETTTPQLPLMILRDPPGDMSYAYLEQNIETCNSFSFDFSTTASLGGFATVHGGPDLSIITGIGVAKKTDVDITADFTFEGSASLGFGTTLAHEICLASTEIFRTSANEFIAGDEGDVYVGGAFNVLVGTNRVLEIDPTTCLPVLEDVLMIMPTSFATTYIYTDAFIRGSVIPGLSALNDAESVSQWESILTYNQTLKDEALFVENVSFSAGVDYEKSVTSTESNSSSMALSSGFVASLSAVQGIQVDGVGFTAGISASIAAETNIAKTSNKSESKTIGYVFGDDDIGDNFTVDIKSDAAGMPVFNLVAGESICPWEPGTQNRAAVGITMSTPNVANNVAEYDLASFQLTLSNTSETGEDQFYGLRVLQESNPNGAAIVINGDGSAVELFVRANKSEIVTITVEKGPDAYVYTDLELELYVPCEQDRAVALGLDVADIIANDPGRSEFFARQKISVDFVKTCQQPIIFTPGNGWLVNESSANMQRVALSNIDLGQIEFDRFRFQYRRQIEGEPFVNGAIIERAQIVGLDSYEFDWDVTNVQDGLYE